MSKVQQLIKDLKLKQEKIEFLTIILESVKDYEKVSTEVRDEIYDLLSDFVERTVLKIENGTDRLLADSAEVFTNAEISALKQVVAKLSQKTLPKQDTQPQPQKSQPVQRDNENPSDKLSFAMANRHLADKDVTVANDQNMIIKGKVVGLDAPHVLVKTSTGPTIKVPIEQVSLA